MIKILKTCKHQGTRFLIYGLVITLAVLIKFHYSGASVQQLRWILSPTVKLVEWLTGVSFVFEEFSGYVNWQHGMVVAKSCAGVNFLIISFCMITMAQITHIKKQWHRLFFVLSSVVIAYFFTIIVNTIRIGLAIFLHHINLSIGWFTAARVHRLSGIFVYFVPLCLLHYFIIRIFKKEKPGWKIYLPLLCYLTVIILIPLALIIKNGVRAGFMEHLLTTLLVSSAIFWGIKKIYRKRSGLNQGQNY